MFIEETSYKNFREKNLNQLTLAPWPPRSPGAPAAPWKIKLNSLSRRIAAHTLSEIKDMKNFWLEKDFKVPNTTMKP